MSFVDVRLHFSVRPVLEYVIPDTARIVKAYILGDLDKTEAFVALDACEVAVRCAADRSPAEEHEAEEEMAPLRACVLTTLSLVHDYLTDLVAVWKEHLTTVHAHVSRSVRALDEECYVAMQRKDRYVKGGHKALAHEEYKREMSRIKTLLHASLQRLREEEDPVMPRPAALMPACDELRNAFANAYGKVPTKRLIAYKITVEATLLAMQRDIASDFLAVCTRLLKE